LGVEEEVERKDLVRRRRGGKMEGRKVF